MKFHILKTSALASLFFFFACRSGEERSDPAAAPSVIRIKGSDTEFQMVKHLAETYMADHPSVRIQVEGGGSNKGISALLANETDICNSSREIKEKEFKAISGKRVKPVPVMFSVDALAIITNYKVGVDSLSTGQVSRLFTGEIKNWKDLGGDDVEVRLAGRNHSSGTHDYFVEKFLSGKQKGPIKECKTNVDILNFVINTPGAVGYVGAGFLLDSTGKPNGRIWAMPVYIENHPAYSPYQAAAVKKGEYVLTRPLYQYVNGTPNELIQDFILFELTKRGQEIVMKHGFFPINDYQSQINRLKGIIN